MRLKKWKSKNCLFNLRAIFKFQNLDDLRDGQSAHFEANLVPVGDPDMVNLFKKYTEILGKIKIKIEKNWQLN